MIFQPLIETLSLRCFDKLSNRKLSNRKLSNRRLSDRKSNTLRPDCLLSGQKAEGDALAVEIDIKDADGDFLMELDFLTTHLRDVD